MNDKGISFRELQKRILAKQERDFPRNEIEQNEPSSLDIVFTDISRALKEIAEALTKLSNKDTKLILRREDLERMQSNAEKHRYDLDLSFDDPGLDSGYKRSTDD